MYNRPPSKPCTRCGVRKEQEDFLFPISPEFIDSYFSMCNQCYDELPVLKPEPEVVEHFVKKLSR